MDFFNKLGDTISSAASEIGEKTKGVTDTAKLQYEMKTKEDLKKEKFLEIGRKYYAANKDSAPENMAELFREIKEADERIEAIKKEISDIKGECVCPNCGARLSAESAFCSECGTKLNDIYEEEQ